MARYQITQVLIVEAESKADALRQAQQASGELELLDWQAIRRLPDPKPQPSDGWKAWSNTLGEQLTGRPGRDKRN